MKLPAGWRKDRLGDLIVGNIRNGYSPVCDLSGDTCGWMLSLGALTPHGLDYSQRKTAPVDPALTRVELQDNDILISRSNTPDRVGMSSIFHVQEENYFYPDLMMRFQFDSDRLLPLFGWYFLNTPEARSYFKRKASGTSSSMVKITSATVRSLEISYPPLPEQRRIAEFLGTWDEAIEKLERLVEAKEKRLDGLVQTLLANTKKHWSVFRLGELFRERAETNCPSLELLAITRDRGVIRRSELDKVDSSSEDKSKYRRIYPDDIGYNTMRMWQGVCGVSHSEGIVSPAYTILIPEKNVNATFSEFYFKAPHVIDVFKRHSQGLVDDTLNLKYHHFAKIKLPFPELAKQIEIAEILSTAQGELRLLKKELAALQRQKRGLMQKLLTGIWRV
ncbi:MAG: restriction endonuclease subunit S [Victivallales bacterium]